jgi:hypothetical protein
MYLGYSLHGAAPLVDSFFDYNLIRFPRIFSGIFEQALSSPKAQWALRERQLPSCRSFTVPKTMRAKRLAS